MSTRLVLAGAGHAHLELLRRCGLQPSSDVDVTVISPGATHVYSGMVPGYLAGMYSFDDVSVSIETICRHARARFISDRVTNIDRSRRVLVTASGVEVPYDLLSINFGSRALGAMKDDVRQHAVVAKPFDRVQQIRDRLESLARGQATQSASIWVVGGGAAGVELAFAAAAAMKRHAGNGTVQLVESGDRLLRGYETRIQQLAHRTLQERGVVIQLHTHVAALAERRIGFSDGTSRPADLVLWITGAEPSVSLSSSGLALDDRGFVLVRDTLQSVNDERVFAVGDSATLQHAPQTPKAGVYAVRQAPVLWNNLVAPSSAARAMQRYVPQSNYLSLLNCCDGTALLRYKLLQLRAGWAWRLKDRIDRRFMRRYQSIA
ncbi:MAG: FAD-dependent oxidoreductase [Acidobacteriota bacterium]